VDALDKILTLVRNQTKFFGCAARILVATPSTTSRYHLINN